MDTWHESSLSLTGHLRHEREEGRDAGLQAVAGKVALGLKRTENVSYRFDGGGNVGLAGTPVDDANPHGPFASPRRPAEEGDPASIDRLDSGVGSSVMVLGACIASRVEKANQPLIQRRTLQDLNTRQ